MAEDLTEYYKDLDVKVRYMHSDVDVVERSQILHDLRAGEFDVLVGINLLREGLDLPEVSLVGIFDADKEGFLRSGTTLIQTIGRAARNINGRAILYGDEITGSMQYAIDETKRRRKKQEIYNEEHKITPKGIKKNITDIMEGAHVEKRSGNDKIETKNKINIENSTPELMIRNIKKLEKKMYQHARDLEFEDAANIRDQIEVLQKSYLGFEKTETG
mgnify:CR=1 FL=1